MTVEKLLGGAQVKLDRNKKVKRISRDSRIFVVIDCFLVIYIAKWTLRVVIGFCSNMDHGTANLTRPLNLMQMSLVPS